MTKIILNESYVDPTSKYYIDRMWEEYHKVKNDLAAVRIDASSTWQDYHKMKEELADTKCKLGQAEDYINETLKPDLADAKIKLKMAQSAWDELDKSHTARAKLHDELIIAEGQRDQWKMRAEKAEETVTLAVARADEFEREYLRVTREYMHLHAERDAPRVLSVVCVECNGIGYLTVHQSSADGGTVTTRKCSCNVSPLLINATADF